jgi:hypothetical protein
MNDFEWIEEIPLPTIVVGDRFISYRDEFGYLITIIKGVKECSRGGFMDFWVTSMFDECDGNNLDLVNKSYVTNIGNIKKLIADGFWVPYRDESQKP